MNTMFKPVRVAIVAAIVSAASLSSLEAVAVPDIKMQASSGVTGPGVTGQGSPASQPPTKAISQGKAASQGTGSVVGAGTPATPPAASTPVAASTPAAPSTASAPAAPPRAASPSTPPAPPSTAAASAPKSAATKSADAKPAAKGGAKLSAIDREFVTKAAQAGHAEIAAGKLAAANAGNAEVKKFGEMMAQAHAKSGDELMQITSSKGVTVPKEADKTHKQLAKQLEKLNGDKFDRLYMREAGVKDHKAAVALFTKEAKSGKDPELKAFAEKSLPTIKEHLQTAQNVYASVNTARK